MNQYELDEIVRLHNLWLKGDSGGVYGDFSNSELIGLDFEGYCLHKANLSNCEIVKSNFHGVNLSNSILDGSKIVYALFPAANFMGASLKNVFFRHSIIFDSSFKDANIFNAVFDLWFNNVNLEGVNLKDADFSGSIRIEKYF